MPEAITGVIVVLVTGVGLLAGLNRYQEHRPQSPEIARKLLHVGMGILALALPWLFDNAWPVFLLAGVGMIILCGIRLSHFLQCRLGGSIDCIARTSYGDLCFLLAIALLFGASRESTLLYVIPITILTFADSGAALVGVSFGRRRYPVPGSVKSIEGSAAFFVIALSCSAVLLWAFGGQCVIEIFIMAVLLAFATTFLEALSGKGFDNLTIPVGAFLLLQVSVGSA